MAITPNFSIPRQRLRRLVTTATLFAVALSACTSPGEGSITDTSSPTPAPSESPTSEPMFALEIPENICPTTEVIPAELAAPETIGYTDESEPRNNGNHPYQRCAYFLDEETASLDGTQAVERITVDFYTTDGSPLEPLSGDFFSVDFEKVEAAEYFRDWEQATDTTDLNISFSSLKDSYYVTFESFASINNLYIYSSMSFVMTDRGPNAEASLNAAAYQILEAIVAPVVADLERQ